MMERNAGSFTATMFLHWRTRSLNMTSPPHPQERLVRLGTRESLGPGDGASPLSHFRNPFRSKRMSEFDLSVFRLRHGSHKNPKQGLCVMEAVAFVAGERHGDHPECACPVLTGFAIRLNDRMKDGERDAL